MLIGLETDSYLIFRPQKKTMENNCQRPNSRRCNCQRPSPHECDHACDLAVNELRKCVAGWLCNFGSNYSSQNLPFVLGTHHQKVGSVLLEQLSSNEDYSDNESDHGSE
jgi:hypothetical protein